MTDPTSTNPLQRHFRQPAIYIKLTSGGKYWQDGSLDLPVTGEIPVYPMTAKDEIMLRTPDALINGTSVVNVIESCCPNIKDAWAMPSIDVDSTLIAIRIASYGQSMTITAQCSSCKEENDYEVDLQAKLATIQMPDYNQTVETDDGLTIKLKPITYLQVCNAGNIVFEEEKLIRAIADKSVPEDIRKAEFEKHIRSMIELNITNIANATDSIMVEGVTVTNTDHIIDYYRNAKSTILTQVQDKIKEFGIAVGIKEENVECSECHQKFKLAVEFDYAHFFAKGF